MRRPWPTGGCCVKKNVLNIWSEHNYLFSHRLVQTTTCFGPVYWSSSGCIINLISSYIICAWVPLSFVRGLEKTPLCVFSKPCTKLTLHCNHRFGHLKTEHPESLSLMRRHFGNSPRGPAVSMRSELLVAHEKLGQLPLLTMYVVPV